MRIIPPEISETNPSSAEKKIHRLLRGIPEDSMSGFTVFHSVNLPIHDYKNCGEIDFLLVGPRGIFVLEVKGGRVEQKDGVWIHTDRYGGKHRKSESPFDQAKSAAYSFKKRVQDSLTLSFLDDIPIGWGVIFPDIDFNQKSIEWVSQQIIAINQVQSPEKLSRSLNSLIKFSEDKLPKSQKLNPKKIAELIKTIRPDFERVPLLSVRVNEFEKTTVSLTSDQYRYLDSLEANSRILCEGGAGTGKTFLALESARRAFANDFDVILTTRSRPLCEFMKQQEGMSGIRIIDTESLLDTKPAEVLIVDELQDVLNEKDIPNLESSVIGGLENGYWRFFIDRNRQADILGSYEEDSYQYILATNPAKLKIPDNCRNTNQIITNINITLGADIGIGIGGDGPSVQWQWWKDESEAALLLDAHIEYLIEQGIKPHLITILCAADPASDPVISALSAKHRSGLAVLNATNVYNPPRNKVSVARIGLFKGLENSFVCLTGVPGLTEDLEVTGINHLYVAMTRPRVGLWICLPKKLKRAILKLSEAGNATGVENARP